MELRLYAGKDTTLARSEREAALARAERAEHELEWLNCAASELMGSSE
jgi:hypothetical protein